MSTLGRLLEDRATQSPERAALRFDGETISYAELCERAAAAARVVRSHGAGAVAFVLPNRPSSVAAFHGALRAGATVVPLNPLLSRTEIEQRVADSGATLLDPDDLVGEPDFAIAPHAPDDVAVVLYTSGTTGSPKRIELTHGGLRLNAEHIASSALGLHEDDVLFGAAPLAHVFALSGCMNGAIAAGACLALVPRFEPHSALAAIERDGVTVFMGVPAMCAALLAEPGASPRLRLAHIGGAPLPPETLHAFEERFGAVVREGYGMTEAGGAIAVQAADDRVPGSVGRAVPGAELRLAEDGELLVRGPTLMRGADDWFATGDIARIDERGNVFILDRKKDVILRGGYTVYPREVEDALASHPAVRECAVVGVPHPVVGEEVVALVVAHGCSPEELKAYARERVAAYKYPRLVVLVDELPHGPTGKVQRREIDRNALSDLL
ncbi:MAG TPA: AMP-binding protein [Gaiellaceae bacterium]|nr:AMP-binding protein [Gaiellaceae bacterium]